MAELRLRKGWTDQAKILALGCDAWGVKITCQPSLDWGSSRSVSHSYSKVSTFGPPDAQSLLKTQYRQEIVIGPISGMESPGFSPS